MTINVPPVSGTPYGSSCEVTPKLFADPASLKTVSLDEHFARISPMLMQAIRKRPVETIIATAVTPPIMAPNPNEYSARSGPRNKPAH